MKVKVLVIASVLAFIGTFASAGEMNLDSLAGKEWPNLEKALVESNLLKDGQFPTSALAEVAYGKVKRDGLPGHELTKEAYIAFFKTRNNLDEKIAIVEFRKPGRAERITLPGTVASDIEPAPPVAAATPVAVLAEVVTTTAKPVSSDTVLSRKYDVLNGKVGWLESQLQKGGDKERVSHLAGLVSALQADIKGLKGNESNSAQQAELGKLSARLGGLEGRMGKVEQTLLAIPRAVKTQVTDEVNSLLGPLKADVAAAKGLAAEAKRIATAVQGPSTNYSQWAALGGFAVLVSLVLAFQGGRLREVRKVQEEYKDSFLKDQVPVRAVAKAGVKAKPLPVQAVAETVDQKVEPGFVKTQPGELEGIPMFLRKVPAAA